MSALQTINLGTAPAGSDGDTVRSAFGKENANVGVLGTQAALTSTTTVAAPAALTTAHVGKRVNISLAAPGTVNLPAASTCAVDQVTLLRNTGTTVVTLAITASSGDTVSLSKLNPGETALMDTDGVHAWNCLMRGRTNSDNETVIGNCAVIGNETVGGTLAVTGTATINGSAALTAAGNLVGLSNKTTARNNIGVGRTLISTQVVTVFGSQITFVNLPAEFGDFEIEFHSVAASAASGNLALQMSQDNGATFIASSYNWSFQDVSHTGVAATFGGGSVSTITVGRFLNTGYPNGASGSIKLHGLASTATSKNVTFAMSGVFSDGNFYSASGGGQLQAATVVNAFKLSSTSGTVIGTFSLYGINK